MHDPARSVAPVGRAPSRRPRNTRGRPRGSVYYDPEAGAYRDMMHNVVARSQVGGIPLVPTDDQIERAIETGDTDCFLLPADR